MSSAGPQMPAVQLVDGRVVSVPCGADGLPDWAAVAAVYGVPIVAEPVSQRRELSVLDFRRRFSIVEKTGLYSAAATQPLLRAWLDDLSAAATVHLDHPDVVAALDWLMTAGILTAARAAEIRA